MDDVAQFVSGPMRLPVVNKTGLAGRYDLTFDLPPQREPMIRGLFTYQPCGTTVN
jgi:hypothetical protein